jgi:hypothetical protein
MVLVREDNVQDDSQVLEELILDPCHGHSSDFCIYSKVIYLMEAFDEHIKLMYVGTDNMHAPAHEPQW